MTNQNRFMISSISQATNTYYVPFGIPSNVTITPFSASVTCGSATIGTFTYTAYQYDISPLPKFMIISSSNGQITIAANNSIGTF